MDTIAFGKTDLRVSRLAFGTGTHGWAGRSEQTDLGPARLADLLRQAYERGVTFWDLADQYGSHGAAARALRDVPREEVMVATKTTARSESRTRRDVDRFLRELEMDVIDIVLLHFMTRADWPSSHAGAMAALSQAQAAGKVRAVGVSCHGLGALRAAAETDWAEVVLARINPAGVNMGAPPTEVVPLLEQMHAAGKGVYGMKVLGCGQLAGRVREAIEYVLRLGVVHALALGISSRDQLLENVELVEALAPRHPVRQKTHHHTST